MASDRIRGFPLCSAAKSITSNLRIGGSETRKPAADVVVVGKPPVLNSRMLGDWVSYLKDASRSGASVYVDYTDNHLSKGQTEPISGFYQEAMRCAKGIIVPTNGMRDWLIHREHATPKAVHVIPDWNEFEDLLSNEPRRLNSGQAVGLWFGHPTNLGFFIEFLRAKSSALEGAELLVVTTPKAIESVGLVTNSWNNLGDSKIRVKPLHWNKGNMREALAQASWCVIPGDLNSPRKSLASPNRLITALSAGLPTAATRLPSYLEFERFFMDVESQSLALLIRDSSNYSAMLEGFAREKAAEFSWEAVIARWRTLLETGLCSDRETRSTAAGGGGVWISNDKL